MGRSEINPPPASESESESYSEESLTGEFDKLEDAAAFKGAETGAGAGKGAGACMYAPWAPVPFLRRARTPEPDKQSSGRHRRTQSVPEPSCSSAIPAESGQQSGDRRRGAKAARRRAQWQAFMQYMADVYWRTEAAEAALCDDDTDSPWRKEHLSGWFAFLFSGF